MNRFRNTTTRILLVTMIAGMLAACGQNGADTVPAATEATVTEETPTEAEDTALSEDTQEPETVEAVEEEPEEEPHEHEWLPATLEAPKTCSICGDTEGEPVNCIELDLDKITGETLWNTVVPFPESVGCATKTDDNVIMYAFYDYEGNVLNEGSKTIDDKYWTWGYGLPEPLSLDGKVGLQIALCDNDDNIDITLFDREGNLIKEDSFSYYIDKGHISLYLCDDPRYLAETPSEDMNTAIKYLDTQTMQLVDPSEGEHPVWWNVEFDNDKYEYCAKLSGKAQEDIGGYIVKNREDGKWGFTDKDFNELKMYPAATNFNMYGYALVSEDGESYDIVDTEFNIVAKDFVKGEDAWLMSSTMGPGVLFSINTADGWKDYIIK